MIRFARPIEYTVGNRDASKQPHTRRVLMTADAVGGVWSYALELARELTTRGTQVVLATQGDMPSERQREECREVDGLFLLSSPFRLEWMVDPWEDLYWAGRWLLEIEKRFTPDVVHLNSYAHGALPFAAPTVIVAHSCVLSWWREVRQEPAPERFARYRAAVRKGLAGADAVVAPTQWMLDSLRGLYGDIRNPHVIPNGRDATRFWRSSKAERIVTCGRLWDEAKNLRVVDAAAARVTWPVDFIGPLRDPEGGSCAPVHAHALGPLAERDVATHLARSAICAHPAKYEPFGLVPLEAALAGCALVLGDIPSLRETWGDVADYVDPADVNALVEALDALIRDPDRRSRKADASHRRAGELTPAAMAEAYLDLYDAILLEPALRTAAGPG